jgi:hypothetical protein
MFTPELVKVANLDVTLVLEKPLDIKAFINHVRRFVEPMTTDERATDEAFADKIAPVPTPHSFPPLSHLADATEGSRNFAQQIWEASRAGRYLFVGAHPGAELELITCELSDWYGFASLPIHQFSIGQIESLEVLQAIRELPGQNQVSKLVAVTDFGEATRNQVELVQKLLSSDPKLLPTGGREICWVYYVDMARFPQMLPETAPDMFDLIKKNLIVLPPLGDLATYLKLHLDLFARREGDAIRARLASEAVSVLLDYNWPGNYAEVVDVARRIAATFRNAPLTGEDAAKILGKKSAVAPSSLELYLLGKQREFIWDLARRGGIEPRAVLQNLKLDPALIAATEDIDNLGLLYLDLLPHR